LAIGIAANVTVFGFLKAIYLEPLPYSHSEELVQVESRAFDAMAVLLTFFAGVAVVVGSAGVYGVTTYGVTQRLKELAVRRALGATRRSILTLVLRDVLLYATFGLFLALPVAFVVSAVMSSSLVLVPRMNSFLALTTAGFIVCVVLFAGYFPAARASRTDPSEVLRHS